MSNRVTFERVIAPLERCRTISATPRLHADAKVAPTAPTRMAELQA